MTVTPPGRTILNRIAALPDDTWQRCRSCAALLHHEQVRRHAGVCPECGHHRRLTARERIAQLADPGSFTEHDSDLVAGDPLAFVDRMPYPQRLANARAGTGENEAVVIGIARFDGHPAVLAVLDFAFLGGSMGSAVGEKVTRAGELALAHRIPLIAVSSSGGARMQEGVLSLVQMAKTAAVISRLRTEGVPFVSVLTDPVYGGVAASFAALGDVILAETGTRAGFAGPQVIEQTVREKLPAGFQTAEFLHDHGHIDLVLERPALAETLRRLVAFLTAARDARFRPAPFAAEPGDAGRPGPSVSASLETDAWESVRTARTIGRPTALAYIERIFTGFLPLHGDRWIGDDQAIVGGLAWLGDSPTVVVGHCKGADTAENVRRNFGMPHPAGYRKTMRLARLAERFGIPLVTFVDTPGAYPGRRSEEENQSGAIAECLALCAGLRTPIVTVVIGEGGSGGALALATGDRLLMQENTVFSVISPEGCGTILFGDAGRAPDAARALRVHAPELCRLGFADELVAEPSGGAHADADDAAALVAAALRRHLAELAELGPEELLERRHRRLRSLGAAALSPPAAAEPAPSGLIELEEPAHA